MSQSDRGSFDDLPILGELRERLAARMAAAPTAAAARRRRRPRGGLGWAGAGLRAAPVVAAVAVALIVAAGVLLLRHGHGGGHRRPATPTHPAPPPRPVIPPAISRDIDRARSTVIARDHACATPTNRGPTVDHGSPGSRVLSVLGVLRRAPLPSDPTTKVLYSIGWDAGSGVYVNYIRRARTEYGRSYWIVPEARTSPIGAIPARCDGKFRAALVHRLRHAPAAVRGQAVRDLQQQLATARREAADSAGLCFIAIGLAVRPHPGAVGYGCSPGVSGTVPLNGANGAGDRAGGTIMSGIARDGIVGVILHYAASGRDPARTITSNVVNNVYVLRIPPGTAHQPFPSQVRLRLSDGRVVPASRLAGGGVQMIDAGSG